MRHMASLLVALLPLGHAAFGYDVSLQEGTGGYAGCADSTLKHDSYGYETVTNHGGDVDLVVDVEHYAPG